MVPAVHTSSVVENDQIVYLGVPTGFVVRMEDGRAFYFAGDTALFGDMRLIGEMHKPEIAFLPIGDHYTMGPDAAARAAALLGVRQVVPMHFGTFPLLTGTPDRLKHLVEPRRGRAGAQAGGDGVLVRRSVVRGPKSASPVESSDGSGVEVAGSAEASPLPAKLCRTADPGPRIRFISPVDDFHQIFLRVAHESGR